jgi:recombination protein RecA
MFSYKYTLNACPMEVEMAKKSEPRKIGGSLSSIIDDINKQFGAGSIMRLGEDPAPLETISSGILPLDLALGVGGLPRGRIVEFFGPPSSGKSTVAMHVVAEAQAKGLTCAYIDAEHALDPIYAQAISINLDDLLIAQPNNAEQGLEIAIRIIESGEVAVVVIDSVAALVPRAEIEGEMGDAHVGLMPRIMGQALRKMTGAAARNNVLVIFINQLREKIGVMYGPSEYTPGGKALPYYASVRLDVRRIQAIKQGDEVTANRTRVKVVKNKVAPPFRQAEFDLEFGKGVSKMGALIDCACDFGIIKKSGAWFTYEGENIGQGKEKVKLRLSEDASMYAEIYQRVVESAGILEYVEEELDSE